MVDPSRCMVVVVEDEADSRELLQEVLESRGYRVATAVDGVDALVVLRSLDNVCLVILDLVMPRLDGAGLLKVMAADEKLAALPVCVSTSAPDRCPPGLPCLPKPVDLDSLFSLVAANCPHAAAPN